MPSIPLRIDADACDRAADGAELVYLLPGAYNELRSAIVDPVLQVGRHQQCRGRDDDSAQLDRGEHHIPQGHVVGHHHQDAVATRDAKTPQEIGDLIRALRHLLERITLVGAVFIDDPQRRIGIVPGQGIEIIQRPVKTIENRPLELTIGGLIIGAVRDEEIPRPQKVICRIHWLVFLVSFFRKLELDGPLLAIITHQ